MSTLAKKKYIDVTTGALLPKIVMFSLPLMLTGILQLLFNTADTIVVGRWGGETEAEREIALAAVGSCGSLIALIINFFLGLSVGAGVCVAQDMGARQYGEVGKTVHTGVALAAVCGVVVCIPGMIFARPLLLLMGTEEDVLGAATSYMCAYFVGTPANMIYNYCAAMLRSKGDTTRPMIFLTTAGVVNVFLNLLTVLAFDMGAVGVGIATASSHWVSCILILIHMCRLDDACHLDLRRLRFDLEKLRKMLYIGVPAGIQSIVFAFSNVLIQSSVNSFGKATVAANAVAANITNYVYTAQNTFYHATMTFVGQCVGANRLDRIRPIAFNCLACVTVVGLLLSGIVLLFGEELISLFSPGNAEVVRIGMVRVWYVGLPYFLAGIMEVGSGVLRGLGKSMTSMLVSVLGTCVFRVIWIMVIFKAFRSLEILYISYPISWALTAACHFFLAALALRKARRRLG